ncbi:MAG: VOC family protein [Sphingomonadaceae bacterium]
MAHRRSSIRRLGARHGLALALFGVASLTASVALSAAALVGAHEAPGRVTGIGGVFQRAEDPRALIAWYEEHLGIAPDQGTFASFFWRQPDEPDAWARTIWSLFPADSDYLPAGPQAMVNYRVDDLDALLARLEAKGIEQVKPREDHVYGRFAWVEDGEGNRLELWEAPPDPGPGAAPSE